MGYSEHEGGTTGDHDIAWGVVRELSGKVPAQNLFCYPIPQIARSVRTMRGYMSDSCVDESFKDFFGIIAVFIRKILQVFGCGWHGYYSGSLSICRGAGVCSSKNSSRSSLPLVGCLPVLSLYHIPAAGSIAQAISSQE